ncbi:electron transfer flavoprotein subunit alpha/FixB family protein [Clostridium lacusfryxellense]|uniref:electron transfer flavoprotein subunit alpha/FixB family protein n=1 Tax=Clostridium lacusfryxellense TaxID=205328 RepID=UPI001C0AB0CE|nr:electron transfer flavoprotein subunit alpha/FixB family protein [Clostridium lacusfryxellense]MBU3112074.1 electron transfer flavoprotein subunit alpha/FixB family protein [Clostridium lacusfryxellense]
MNRSLIYFDEEDFQNSIDLLEVVNQIYKDREYETYAICFNHNDRVIDGKFDYLITIQNQEIKNYDVQNITNCIEELHHIYDFDSILIPATYLGRMLAPKLSMRLKVGLVADVTAIEHNNGKVEMVRPAFGGKIFAGIVNRNCKTIMMSVRPNVFVYTSDTLKKTEKINFKPTTVEPSKIKLLTTIEKENIKDIRESEVLVSGGGGVIEDFEHLYILAHELNGMVSASRSIIDSGIASRSIQVGQSGKTVSPKLYIALGIYGSLQHIEGLKNVENIISVNINKDAPICSLADIVVEGDAIEFIDKLVEKINKNRI